MAFQQGPDRQLRELALFAGAWGGILGGQLLGWRTVCAVERDAYAAAVLAQRQNDGCLEPFPIWSDVETFDGRPWRGIVDVISGGFPCQDISAAGKGAGIEGERSGLWREFARIIREVAPRFVFVENSPMLTSRGLGVVLGDLAALGFDAEWGVLGAGAVGAPHRRERIWIVGANTVRVGCSAQWEQKHAEPLQDEKRYRQKGQQLRAEFQLWAGRNGSALADPNSLHEQGHESCEPCEEGRKEQSERPAGSCGIGQTDVPDSKGERWGEARRLQCYESEKRLASSSEAMAHAAGNGWKARRPKSERREGRSAVVCSGQSAIDGPAYWSTEPDVGRVADGVEFRVDRLKALGNGQVPQCAAEAFRQLYARLMSR